MGDVDFDGFHKLLSTDVRQIAQTLEKTYPL